MAAAIEQRLAEDFGDSPAVLVRSVADFRRVGSSSPYAKAGADPARHHVTFLATAPTKAALTALTLPPSGRDELVVDGKEVYVHTPDGYANTKYTGTFLERRLGVVSTTRNWNTVTKLSELAAPLNQTRRRGGFRAPDRLCRGAGRPQLSGRAVGPGPASDPRKAGSASGRGPVDANNEATVHRPQRL